MPPTMERFDLSTYKMSRGYLAIYPLLATEKLVNHVRVTLLDVLFDSTLALDLRLAVACDIGMVDRECSLLFIDAIVREMNQPVMPIVDEFLAVALQCNRSIGHVPWTASEDWQRRLISAWGEFQKAGYSHNAYRGLMAVFNAIQHQYLDGALAVTLQAYCDRRLLEAAGAYRHPLDILIKVACEYYGVTFAVYGTASQLVRHRNYDKASDA